MQRFAPLCLVLGLACSSSGSLGTSEFWSSDFALVFEAAERGVAAVDGRIAVANPSSGLIRGIISAAEFGGTVRLHVTVERPPGGPGDTSSVTALATLAGAEDDPLIQDELRRLEQRYLDAVREALFALGGRPSSQHGPPGIPGGGRDPWSGGGS